MTFDKAREQYDNDPLFRQVVKTLMNLIDQLEMSPSEVRQAAMFAVYLHEIYNPKPFMVQKYE